jgi:drug/metabolite transporter (DMT)-like permease
VSGTRKAFAFLLVAGIVSVFLAYAGVVISSFYYGFRNLNPMEGFFGPLIQVPIWAGFLVVGGLIFGLPTLLILRRKNLASRRSWLVLTGIVVGAGASALLLATWLGLAVIPLALSLGAVGGGLSALLWFELVEKRIAHD